MISFRSVWRWGCLQPRTRFGTRRAPQFEKPPRNVHDVHRVFRFMEISDERYFFITFTNVHDVHLGSSFEFQVSSFKETALVAIMVSGAKAKL